MSGKVKNTNAYASYTDSLTYLSREAERDGFHNVAMEIDETRKKIESLNNNANDNTHGIH